MPAERSRIYPTVVFLQVSFQAIKHSMAGKASDELPCWLDGKMLTMLCRDLKACRDQTGTNEAARQGLDAACAACETLLAECPGGLDSRLCHHHLDIILAGLQGALSVLASAPTSLPRHPWQSAARHLREGWRRLS